MKRLFLLGILLLQIAGCGIASSPEILPAAQRRDLLHLYYGSTSENLTPPGQLEETKDHINVYMVMPWDGDGIKEMQKAKAANKKVILYLSEAHEKNGELLVTQRFQKLQDLDLLSNIISIYPIDEPDLLNIPDVKINEVNTMIRRVMTSFGFNVPLSVIYTGGEQYPGASTYDWIAFDDYDLKENIFNPRSGKYTRMKQRFPDKKFFLIPGGSDPWQQDPAAFLDKANRDPQVIGIISFLWRERIDEKGVSFKGIRTNGKTEQYRAMGKLIIQ